MARSPRRRQQHATHVADHHPHFTEIPSEDQRTDFWSLHATWTPEALRRTIDTGEAWYFSRSRKALWRKGETSGHVQRVREIRTDCDQDALLVTVEQTGRGAACHTGRKTCFYRRVVIADGEARLADTGESKLFDPEVVYNR